MRFVGGAEREMVTWLWLHPLPPYSPCLGQVCKLREEKEQSMSQVQELETSLAELRNQIGKLRLE